MRRAILAALAALLLLAMPVSAAKPFTPFAPWLPNEGCQHQGDQSIEVWAGDIAAGESFVIPHDFTACNVDGADSTFRVLLDVGNGRADLSVTSPSAASLPIQSDKGSQVLWTCTASAELGTYLVQVGAERKASNVVLTIVSGGTPWIPC